MQGVALKSEHIAALISTELKVKTGVEVAIRQLIGSL